MPLSTFIFLMLVGQACIVGTSRSQAEGINRALDGLAQNDLVVAEQDANKNAAGRSQGESARPSTWFGRAREHVRSLLKKKTLSGLVRGDKYGENVKIALWHEDKGYERNSKWPKDLKACRFQFEKSKKKYRLTEFLGISRYGMVFAAGTNHIVKVCMRNPEVADCKSDQTVQAQSKFKNNSPTDRPAPHIVEVVRTYPLKCAGLSAYGMKAQGETLGEYKDRGYQWTWHFVKQLIVETLQGMCELRTAGITDAGRSSNNVIVHVENPTDLNKRRLLKLVFIDILVVEDRRALTPRYFESMTTEDRWAFKDDFHQFSDFKKNLDEFDQEDACTVVPEELKGWLKE